MTPLTGVVDARTYQHQQGVGEEENNRNNKIEKSTGEVTREKEEE